ncbi:MAG: hypothetical protein ACW967_02015 [Candidatus Hodarchaeales archaeon]
MTTSSLSYRDLSLMILELTLDNSGNPTEVSINEDTVFEDYPPGCSVNMLLIPKTLIIIIVIKQKVYL